MFYTKNGQLLPSVFQHVGLRQPPSSTSIDPSSPFTLGLNPSALAAAEYARVPLFPAIGMRHQNESVRANFGQDPFKFDIVDYVAQARAAVRVEVLKVPVALSPSLPASSQHQPQPMIQQVRRGPEMGTSAMAGVGVGVGPDGGREDSSVRADEEKAKMARLVMDYLTYHGYAKTARAFRARNGTMLGDAAAAVSASALPSINSTVINNAEEEEDKEVARRAEIIRAVTSGNIPHALALLGEAYPAVLTHDGGLILFKLRCRQFVELLLAAAEMRKRVEQQKEDGNGKATATATTARMETENLGPGTGMMDETEGMDVDDDAPALSNNQHAASSATNRLPPSMPPPSAPSSDLRQWEAALHAAIAYGQALQADYQRASSSSSAGGVGNDENQRKAIRTLFERTFGLIAYHDPEAEDPAFAGPQARVKLAAQVNDAILREFYFNIFYHL
jgi:Ran-binding protein 9/10